jgi:hypothetical protein
MASTNASIDEPGWTAPQQLGHTLVEFAGGRWLPASLNFRRYRFRYIAT